MATQLRDTFPSGKVSVEKKDEKSDDESIRIRTQSLVFQPWQLAAVGKIIEAATVEFYRSGTSVSMKIY